MAYGNEKPPSRVSRARPFVYGFWFSLIFACAAVELGLVSDFLHRYGNGYDRYPTMEFKHDLGIILFSCVVTFLYVLSHPWSNHFMSAVWAFILAVFWGTAAGVIFQVSPFRAYTCGRPASSFTPEWAAWLGNCRRVVTMEAFAWTLWGLYLFLFIGLLVEMFQCSRRRDVRPFYERPKVEA
ncbi:hypothetical protein EIP86_011164 [Pleurotus ostreatoroseus]|nr:hypothetical protein EIP86_011164 [Pleurotus ostreatoroseus]